MTENIGAQFDEGAVGVTFGPDKVADRPALAVKIAQIANAWAVLEANSGTCLGVLLRGEAKASIAMLSKVQTATAKSQAIRAVGIAVLSAQDLAELKGILTRYEALAKRRNDVVHGMWGTTPQWPEYLVWAPPEVISNTAIGMLEMHMSGKGEEFLEEQKAKFVVWKAERFDDLFADIQQLIKDLIKFTMGQQMAHYAQKFGQQVQAI